MKLKLLLIICSLITLHNNAQIAGLGIKNNNGANGFKVDYFPDIYGGDNELKRFLHDHLIYPKEDLKAKKEGKVVLSFIVTKTGATTDIMVTKPVSPAIDKEAIRLLKLIDWIPACKGNEAVSVGYSLAIIFSISKYKKHVKERGFDTTLYTNLPIDTSLNIYETAERSPLFNNADKTFIEFIYTNIEYPEHAARQNIEGNIKLAFVVEPNGQTSNIKIINGGLGGGCNNEAIRIIALTKWLPAVKNNKYIRYRMDFVINFSLKRNNKAKDNFSVHTLAE